MKALAVPRQEEDLVGYGGWGGGVEGVDVVGEALPLGWAAAALSEGCVTGVGLVDEAEVGCRLQFVNDRGHGDRWWVQT